MTDFKTQQTQPTFWDVRSPLREGTDPFLPLVNYYLNLNDNKLRRYLSNKMGLTADLGCGTGRFLNYADVGIDFSVGMLRRAQRKCPKRHLIRASILNLPFRDGIFDFAFIIDVILHIAPADRDKAFQEGKRVSRELRIFQPGRSWFSSILYRLRKLLPTKTVTILSILIASLLDRIKPRFVHGHLDGGLADLICQKLKGR